MAADKNILKKRLIGLRLVILLLVTLVLSSCMFYQLTTSNLDAGPGESLVKHARDTGDDKQTDASDDDNLKDDNNVVDEDEADGDDDDDDDDADVDDDDVSIVKVQNYQEKPSEEKKELLDDDNNDNNDDLENDSNDDKDEDVYDENNSIYEDNDEAVKRNDDGNTDGGGGYFTGTGSRIIDSLLSTFFGPQGSKEGAGELWEKEEGKGEELEEGTKYDEYEEEERFTEKGMNKQNFQENKEGETHGPFVTGENLQKSGNDRVGDLGDKDLRFKEEDAIADETSSKNAPDEIHEDSNKDEENDDGYDDDENEEEDETNQTADVHDKEGEENVEDDDQEEVGIDDEKFTDLKEQHNIPKDEIEINEEENGIVDDPADVDSDRVGVESKTGPRESMQQRAFSDLIANADSKSTESTNNPIINLAKTQDPSPKLMPNTLDMVSHGGSVINISLASRLPLEGNLDIGDKVLQSTDLDKTGLVAPTDQGIVANEREQNILVSEIQKKDSNQNDNNNNSESIFINGERFRMPSSTDNGIVDPQKAFHDGKDRNDIIDDSLIRPVVYREESPDQNELDQNNEENRDGKLDEIIKQSNFERAIHESLFTVGRGKSTDTLAKAIPGTPRSAIHNSYEAVTLKDDNDEEWKGSQIERPEDRENNNIISSEEDGDVDNTLKYNDYPSSDRQQSWPVRSKDGEEETRTSIPMGGSYENPRPLSEEEYKLYNTESTRKARESVTPGLHFSRLGQDEDDKYKLFNTGSEQKAKKNVITGLPLSKLEQEEDDYEDESHETLDSNTSNAEEKIATEPPILFIDDIFDTLDSTRKKETEVMDTEREWSPLSPECPRRLELSAVPHDVTALVAFPGALSNWFRDALEQLSGEPSDSLYNVMARLKEGDVSALVRMPHEVVVHTHAKHSKDFDRAILLINNPVAVEMKHLRFLPFAEEWRRYFLWDHTFISWLSSDIPTLALTADDLYSEPEVHLRRIAHFLEIDKAKIRMNCALMKKPPEMIHDVSKMAGIYSREKRLLSRSIDAVIEKASKEAPDILQTLFEYKNNLNM